MGKKYIIELPENTHWVQWILESTKDHHPYMDFKQVEDLTPYTAPDLEQVRKEAYEEGKKQAKVQAELDVCHDIEKVAKGNYTVGLADAWEAARKLSLMSPEEAEQVFPGAGKYNRFNLGYSGVEAIEKIRQYEQEKRFCVGDEFENESGKRFVIIKMDGIEIDRYVDEEGKTYCMVTKYKVIRKTGRHFPEIAAVLEKMRENK